MGYTEDENTVHSIIHMVIGCELRQIISLAIVHYGDQCPWLTPRTLIPHNGHLLGDYLNRNGNDFKPEIMVPGRRDKYC